MRAAYIPRNFLPLPLPSQGIGSLRSQLPGIIWALVNFITALSFAAAFSFAFRCSPLKRPK